MVNSYSTQKTLSSQEISGIFPVFKRAGETLAVLLERFREREQLSQKTKITYAGRLDPAAEGVVLLLVGEARFQKNDFLALPKTYLVTILFGIATDTGDLLGIPLEIKPLEKKDPDWEALLSNFVGEVEFLYPAYSSRPVEGKPLFVHAREKREVTLPVKKSTVFSIKKVKEEQVPFLTILEKVAWLASTVQGDFRQEEIMQAWESREGNTEDRFLTLTVRVEASSGTYMRSLAEAIGKKLGTAACAYHIMREKVGEDAAVDEL